MPRFLALLALASLPLSLGLTIGDQDMRAGTIGQQLNTLRSGLGWHDCSCGTILRPKHTEEVADIVMALYRDQQVTGQKYLVRASSQGFMSHNNFSCACASVASDTRAVMLDMSAMNKVLEFNDDRETVTVQAGITFEALERTLLEYDMSLPGVVVAPQLSGMTVGAAIVTSAHGSSLVGPANIAAFLQSALLVDGTGDIHTLDTPGELLEGSLGMLGVVTEVTMYVQAKKKMAVRQIMSEDFDLVADLRDIIDNSEALALDVTWNPTAGMYQARVWHETDAGSRGDARNMVLQPPADWLAALPDRVHADQLDAHDREGHMCEIIGEMSHFPPFVHSPGQEPDESTPPDTAVGWLNHMASASCTPHPGLADAAKAAGAKGVLHGSAPSPSCLLGAAKWTPYELAIHSQDFSAWLADARAVLRHARGCPPFTLTFRFVGESDAPLALSSGRQVVAVELSVLSSPRAGGLPPKFARLHEELLQMTMCKYNGRPQWALATNRLFRGAPCAVRDLYGSAFDKFLAQRSSYDPAAMFVPPLFEDVVERREAVRYPGCAARMDCFCTADEHCGRGHVCVPGHEFPEYRVCAPIEQQERHEL
ncbi:hypothetical protein CHLRE_03g177600v5 [Chlamydomonas reinhardtii]|uniref:FAD-binding PCMH-type domain-containing protein n=1 Tax=Chlamydomonas reinhardtii TaxID=3055 RepID=A0A2K3DXI0_CHLRE|nr:uncharacterized protein CHLRE_03g177600v5 [Chlamydomonas reinhardtii]PNW85242.1 hypothetical protein CHLRE_03g177600v5 [Chlamydomonas reinhardtii]